MESLDLLLAALKTGAAVRSDPEGSAAVQRLYLELKDALRSVLAGDSTSPGLAEPILALFEQNPETCLPILAEAIRKSEASQDAEVIEKADRLLASVSVGRIESNNSIVNVAGGNVYNYSVTLQSASPSQPHWRDLNYLRGLAVSRLTSMLTAGASENSEFFQKYVWQVYVKREGADEAFARFLLQEDDEKRCFLVTGKAGKGKTNLLCHFASSFTSRPGLHVPVLLSSSELKLSERDLRSVIVQRLFERERSFSDLDFLELAGFITSQGGSLVVFLDAVNELEGTDAFRNFSGQLEHLIRDCRAREHRVLFCLTCRTEIWPHFKSSQWAQNSILEGSRALSSGEPTLELGDFHEKDIDQISQGYFNWYAIEAELLGSARRSCCDPLMLRYLCAAYTHRKPNDKSTSPDQIPSSRLGAIRTLRRKEAFDSFVKNRRQAMLKAVRFALRNDDERLTYRYTTLYLITMAYRMYQKAGESWRLEKSSRSPMSLATPTATSQTAERNTS